MMHFREITIYGRADCVQCKATKTKAEELGLTVHYVDLDEHPDTAHQLRMEGFRSIPVVKAGDHLWTGYRPDLLSGLMR